MRMIVVSGQSGAGKTIALQTLEDLDYYCVDNLPLELLRPLAETLRKGAAVEHVAVGIDVRNLRRHLPDFPELLAGLRAEGLEVEVLYLLADEQTLLKRYSETRRRHPLSRSGAPLTEALAAERDLLEPVAACADLSIDTSHTHVHQLRDLVRTRLHDTPPERLSILFESFGYKSGLPGDADLVFDVRCLPNPHWQPGLRPLTGRDRPVIDYLADQPAVRNMVDDVAAYLARWIPTYEASDRNYLTVAIGCTGGRHRSVYVVERLAEHFQSAGHEVTLRHRELA